MPVNSNSFSIFYKIWPMKFDYDEFKFLDEISEIKAKKYQIFKIHVELIKKNFKEYSKIFI